MPNPQVHAAVGMIGAAVFIGIACLIIKNVYPRKAKKLVLFLPLFILIGAFISLVPDMPELSKDFPSVFGPVHIDYHDKPLWHSPLLNLCFLHPLLDSKFEEQYDTFGLFLTLLVFNCISLFYLSLLKRK